MKGKKSKCHKRQRKFAAALLVGAMGTAAAEPAIAQEVQHVSADERVQFDIATQPLSSALSEFARQARVNALYFSDDLRGLSSPPLRGSFRRQQALDLLLERSGYNGRISSGNLVLVQEQPSRPQQESAATSGALGVQSGPSNTSDEEQADEEIVVTGTRIRGATPAGANVITLDAEELRETGRSTLQEALAPLPQNFLGGQNELTQLQSNTGGNNTTFGSSVNLRGLGADATLTLVNGRRLAPGGVGNFVDISTIPLAAVERVEILADGASATYGSYRFLTPLAAQRLNEVAREEDPFSLLGTTARTAIITSIVQRSGETWQVSWIEATHGANGGARSAYTGLFTVRFDRPRSSDALARNPLGLFITEFSFSPEAPATTVRGAQP